MKTAILLASLMLASCAIAANDGKDLTVSGFSVGYYRAHHNNVFFVKYLEGLGDGFAFANMDLRTTSRPMLFCPPARLTLTVSIYQESLDSRFLRLLKNGATESVMNDTPVAIFLLKALRDTFPCNLKQQ